MSGLLLVCYTQSEKGRKVQNEKKISRFRNIDVCCDDGMPVFGETNEGAGSFL